MCVACCVCRALRLLCVTSALRVFCELCALCVSCLAPVMGADAVVCIWIFVSAVLRAL